MELICSSGWGLVGSQCLEGGGKKCSGQETAKEGGITSRAYERKEQSWNRELHKKNYYQETNAQVRCTCCVLRLVGSMRYWNSRILWRTPSSVCIFTRDEKEWVVNGLKKQRQDKPVLRLLYGKWFSQLTSSRHKRNDSLSMVYLMSCTFLHEWFSSGDTDDI